MTTRVDCIRVTNHFAAGSRDVTPAPARHAARVLYAPVSRDPELTRRCARVLSNGELQRAERLATSDGRALFKQRRAFRRFCAAVALGWSRPMSQIAFSETENGRPYLSDSPDFCFSFSSCRFGFIGAWSPSHGIGVDFEDQTRDPGTAALAQRFFSAAEVNAVAVPDAPAGRRNFFRLWCLKEAALKSIGEGLPFGLDAFAFELDPSPRVAHAPAEHGGAERFNAYVIEATDTCTALVIRSLTC